MTLVDHGAAVLETAAVIDRQPIAGLLQGGPESPMVMTRRVPGDVHRQRISLSWPSCSVNLLRGVLLHWKEHRLQRPFTFTAPGDTEARACIYAAPPTWRKRNFLTAELSVELLEIDTAEF